jgi:tyrosyl-tRNA synthetase
MAAADLTRHAVDVLPKGELDRKLKLGRPLRVKLGIDPTAPDIHLGFAYVLDRLGEFQRAGHTVVLIVGDYTARIGDPSGRSDERPVLPGEVLDANAKEFAELAFRVLDRERTEIRFNGEWLGKLSYAEVVQLARTITVARILERADFAERLAAHEPISISELLYPLMQAYDSIAVRADVEIGGTDQLHNLLAGRHIMEQYGLPAQVVVTYPLLVGTDGTEKMSKSRGNYIAISEDPREMFKAIMRIPDDPALPQWWDMLVDRPRPPLEPRDLKIELARNIVRRWHGDAGASEGEEAYITEVQQGQPPPDAKTRVLSPGVVHLPKLLAETFGNSTSYWRRVIVQGGLHVVNGGRIHDFDVRVEDLDGKTLRAGKKDFLHVLLATD